MFDNMHCLVYLRVIARVQGLIVVWPTHWRRPELASASSPVSIGKIIEVYNNIKYDMSILNEID